MTTAVLDPATRPHAPSARAPRVRPLPYEPEPDAAGGGRDGPAQPGRAARPDVPVPLDTVDPRETAALCRRAHDVLRLAVEVLDGRRPLAHLAPHLAPPALRYVRAARRTGAVHREASRLTSLHLSRPVEEAVEVAAVCRLAGRVRALAARFEGHAGDPAGWRCVTVRLC
jgi:hypothetical protein